MVLMTFLDDDKGKNIPFFIKPPRISRYVKAFCEDRYLSFLTEDKQLSKKYYEPWLKLEALLAKRLIKN